jgi:hypothetical protein
MLYGVPLELHVPGTFLLSGTSPEVKINDKRLVVFALLVCLNDNAACIDWREEHPGLGQPRKWI